MPAAAEQSRRRRRDAGTCLALLLFTTCGTALATGVLVQGNSGDDCLDLSAETTSYEIFGNGGWGTIIRSFGDDRVTAGPGNNIIDGAGGNATAFYARPFGDFSLAVTPEGVAVRDIVGHDGSDSLMRIEAIEFADGRYADGTFEANGGSNSAPIAGKDMSTVTADRTVNIAVLANDADPVGDTPSATLVMMPGHGTATMHAYLGADEFSYTISDGTGRTANATVRLTVESVDTSDPLMAQLAAAPEGSWVRLNRNRFSDVWVPAKQRPNTPGYTNPAKVVFAWGSMAWDPNRAQLIFWGGGHANYSGNEVYRFDARSGLWARASLPSDVTNPLGDNQFFAVDGPRRAPTSSHTYDNQEFLPLSDRFVTFGGAKFNGKHRFVLEDGITSTGPYFWDPNRAGQDSVGGTRGSQVAPNRFADVDGRQMWTNRDTVRNQGVAAVRPSGDFVNSTSAYEEFEGRDSILVTESPRAGGRLFRYVVRDVDDASRDEWILVGGKGISYGNQGAGAVDSGRRLYARTARTSSGWGLVVWNTAALGSRNFPYAVHPTDPRGLPLISELHGMDFDPVRNVFVIWDGGPDVWHLTPGSSPGPAGWTAVPALSRPDLPTPLQSDASLRGHTGSLTPQRGVLGKWKYSRRYDVMLGMVSPEAGDVWAFKPTGWRPPSK